MENVVLTALWLKRLTFTFAMPEILHSFAVPRGRRLFLQGRDWHSDFTEHERASESPHL